MNQMLVEEQSALYSIQQAEESDAIFFMFPGNGYQFGRPIFYYSTC